MSEPRQLVTVAATVFAALSLFGFGWFGLLVAGIRSPAYDAVLGVLNAPLAVVVRRLGLIGAGDGLGILVFLCYYALLAGLVTLVYAGGSRLAATFV